MEARVGLRADQDHGRTLAFGDNKSANSTPRLTNRGVELAISAAARAIPLSVIPAVVGTRILGRRGLRNW